MTNDENGLDSNLLIAKIKSIRERLKVMEDLVAQNKRALTALAEQATGKGVRLAKELSTKTILKIPHIFLVVLHLDQKQQTFAVFSDDPFDFLLHSSLWRLRTRSVSQEGEEKGRELTCWTFLL